MKKLLIALLFMISSVFTFASSKHIGQAASDKTERIVKKDVLQFDSYDAANAKIKSLKEYYKALDVEIRITVTVTVNEDGSVTVTIEVEITVTLD